MALARSSGIFNMDGGLWFDLRDGKGIGVSAVVASERYANVSSFQTLLANNVGWGPTPWGDQNKRLVDARYGYKIVDSIWTEPKQTQEPYTASALAANPTGGNIIARLSVLRNLENNKYLFVKPGTESEPANLVQFAWVDSHHQATRFSNLLPVVGWLNNSILGDGPAGFEIEQYFFTKAVEGASYSFFGGGPTGPRQIERAYIPFSKEKGKYLWIDDPNLPPSSMTFDFTDDQYAAVRFQDTLDFLTILNATFLGSEAYGWSLPQFYFNRAQKPIKDNPFQLFWCIDQNGPYRCIGYEMPTCDWLCRMAGIYSSDFREYLLQVTKFLLDPKCYPDLKAFNAWWGKQDYAAFEKWLYELWVSCGGKGK